MCHIDPFMAKTPSARPGTRNPRGENKAALLLAWYERVKRPLPWRQDDDPYRVWLSEVMLQQTRVETAIPYYEKFLEAFPSVEWLARASEEQVLALWSGLGYYRRARMLLAAARDVVRAGGFPETAEGWRRLPGVGPYTAAAVASIAYRENIVALDGNLERVLARLEAYSRNPKSAAGRRFLIRAAGAWLDPERPGNSNQALMELGATVCLPRDPLCQQCPIAESCLARRRRRVDDYPYRAPAAPKEARSIVAVCVRQGARLLLFRRAPGSGLLAGTWELPWAESDDPSPAEALAQRYGGTWRVGGHIGTIRHTITHRNLLVAVREGHVEALGQVAESGDARWASLAELDELPHSSLVRKVFLVAAGC